MTELSNLQRALAGLVAAGVPAWYAREELAAQQQHIAAAAKPVAANDKLTMGLIGVGSPASRSLQIYDKVKSSKQIQFTAVCDVDARHLARATGLLKEDAYQVRAYKDFRRLLEDRDLNSVLIGTPDHWHALIAIEAMRQGKDVYCEKPLTLTVGEALALVKVAQQTGRVFQTGSQQRTEFEGRFRLVSELIRAGRIGKVARVEVHSGGNRTSGPLPEAPIPEGLDWDFWLGPTPKVPYLYKQGAQGGALTNCHYEFRWWSQFSDGAWVFVQRNKIEASDKKLLEEPLPVGAVPLYPSRPTDHMGNFLECVKSRQKPICDVTVGASSVIVCHIGVIALRTGKRLAWDPVQHRFDDAEANQLLGRPMRAPWKLEV